MFIYMTMRCCPMLLMSATDSSKELLPNMSLRTLFIFVPLLLAAVFASFLANHLERNHTIAGEWHDVNDQVAAWLDATEQIAPTQLTSPEQMTDRLNINLATASELELLPFIGPAKAQAIIDYRKAHGTFQKLEDVKQVKGIGDGIYAKIKSKIKVE
jgi:comEA protein